MRDIHAQLNADKGTSYSTTVKMLAVMLQKGLIKRNENAQPHVYRAVLTRETVLYQADQSHAALPGVAQ